MLVIDLLDKNRTLFDTVWQFFLELIAPTLCCQCGKVGLYLCSTCFGEIEYTPFEQSIEVSANQIQIFTVARYSGPIRSLISSMKFKKVKAVSSYLADMTIYSTELPPFDLICPIPLHHKRKRKRRFDQVELIAKELAKHHQKPCIPFLVRHKHLLAQSSVKDKQQRLARMMDVYVVNQKLAHSLASAPSNSTILLVDDVFTTGATMHSAAQTLLACNPGVSILGLCIARD